MKVNHIGIITFDMKKSIRLYMKMGYILVGDIILDQIQNNYIAIMETNSAPKLELIMPVNKNSSVYNFKNGYHHLCYEAERNEYIVSEFRKMKVGKIFTQPIVAPALDNREVVFACLQNGTFIELII